VTKTKLTVNSHDFITSTSLRAAVQDGFSLGLHVVESVRDDYNFLVLFIYSHNVASSLARPCSLQASLAHVKRRHE